MTENLYKQSKFFSRRFEAKPAAVSFAGHIHRKYQNSEGNENLCPTYLRLIRIVESDGERRFVI